jgi:hypothetical protein
MVCMSLLGGTEQRAALCFLVILGALDVSACSSAHDQRDQPVDQEQADLVTTKGGTSYLSECTSAGVPAPPTWGPSSLGKWTNLGMASNSLANLGDAYAYRYSQSSPAGVCILITRPDPGFPTTIDIICQGANGNTCFWDGAESTIPATQSFPNSSVKGGKDLSGNAVPCTTCHAGENAFIAHNGIANDALNLNGSSFWMPSAWYNPDVPSGWAQNPGPERWSGYPPSGDTGTPGASTPCLSCHTAGGGAGRFPLLEATIFRAGYCGILRSVTNRPGSLGGMPPGNTCNPNLNNCAAQKDPFTQAMLSHCGTIPVAQSWSESPTAFSTSSATTPYQGTWDHATGDDTSPSHKNLLFDNIYVSGSYEGWSPTDLTSVAPTVFRPSMWIKDPNAMGSSLTVSATDAWGTIWEWSPSHSRNNATAYASTPAAGSPYGYIGHDGWSRIVYRGTDNNIYELLAYDLTNYTQVTQMPYQSGEALGDPIGYSRGLSSGVIYKCGTDNSTICELRLNEAGWSPVRTITTAAALKGTTMPVPVWNGADERVIFYVADDGLHALKDPTDPSVGPAPVDVLVVADTGIVSSPAVYGCGSTSSACNDQNNLMSVVYRSETATSNSIVEMVETGYNVGTWSKKTRYSVSKTSETITGDLAAFVATGPWRNTIVYGNSLHQYYRLQWNGSSYTRSRIYP